MKKLFTLVILPIIACSCIDQKKIHVLFDNSSGITEESALQVNGFQIGEVDKLVLLNNQQTLVVAQLTEDIDLPIDSKFKTSKTSLLGDMAITVELGSSTQIISERDTLQRFF